jgi:ppGpp synthetase/RelA/SpoT-type nucleotidyltranferase
MENKTSYSLQEFLDDNLDKSAKEVRTIFMEGWIAALMHVKVNYKEKATEELMKENEALKIQASNYAYQMDIAKRERDKAEESNKELVEDLKKAVMYMNLDDPIRIKVLKP